MGKERTEKPVRFCMLIAYCLSRKEENETDHLLTKYHKKIRLYKLKNKENYILVYDWVCVEEVNHRKHLVIYGAEANTVARKVGLNMITIKFW